MGGKGGVGISLLVRILPRLKVPSKLQILAKTAVAVESLTKARLLCV